MPRTRRAFTDEFKREAVRLVKQPDAKVTHIARDLGIEQSVLRRWRSQTVAELTRSIRESFDLSDHTYGSPRVWHDLRAAGEQCGVNRVARLMKVSNLQDRRKRRRLPGD